MLTLPDSTLEMLVIAPHPDDAEIFCGGLILKMTSCGYRVGILDLSQAELSTFGTVAQRQQETANASSVLNLYWRYNLSLPNCSFYEYSCSEHSGTDQGSAVSLMVEVLRATRPEVIVTPYPVDRHPDHVQAGHITNRALFMAGLIKYQAVTLPPFSPKLVLQYQFRSEFVPSFVVDISDFIEQKYDAVKCYASQIYPQGGATTLLSSQTSLTAFRARDAHLGALIGVEYGEGYLSRTMLRIDDIIAHSRSNSTDVALFNWERRV